MSLDEALAGAVRAGDVDAVQAALDAGASPNSVSPSWETHLLAVAAAQGVIEVVRTLLRAGADVGASSGWHWTALRAAVAHGRADIAALLLESGADPNLETERGSVLVQSLSQTRYSPSLGATRIVRLLLSAGARPGEA